MQGVQCFFKLNGQAMGELVVRLPHQTLTVPAYSGARPYSNQKSHMCIPHVGAVPTGRYYIIDRQSGGRLGWLKDFFNEKEEWFALYKLDDKIDDFTLCEGYKRGNFRIHYSGSDDGSRGCVTLPNLLDFKNISSEFKRAGRWKVAGFDIETYGLLTVF